MASYIILSIFISLTLSCTDLDLNVLRSNCDPLLQNWPYSLNNFEVCRDKYALVRNCLDFSKAAESLSFRGYACDLENELGYNDTFPYRRHSRAYNSIKDKNSAEYSIPNGFVWNFQIFNDYQTLRQVCIIPESPRDIILPSRTSTFTSSTPVTNAPIGNTLGPSPPTTFTSSAPVTNAPIGNTLGPSPPTATTLPGTNVAGKQDVTSPAAEDSTKLITIVAGTCVVLVLIPIVAITIAMIKGEK